MAVLDFICKNCYWRVDNQTKLKCRRGVAVKLVCNTKSMYQQVSARSSGALSKDGMTCKHFSEKI